MRTTLLSGIVGSTAYGLATPESDIDRLGIYAVPTVELLGLHKPIETVTTDKPDVTMHEVGKFCRLALAGNPTVMELLWLPESLYEVTTDWGEELLNIRGAFLSAPRVRNAYFGYATQQFRKLEDRGDGTFGPDLAKRTAKHARHLFRLLAQGLQLWISGQLIVELGDPEKVREFGDRVAAGDIELARVLLGQYEKAFDSEATCLPSKPEESTVEDWLLQVRHQYYESP